MVAAYATAGHAGAAGWGEVANGQTPADLCAPASCLWSFGTGQSVAHFLSTHNESRLELTGLLTAGATRTCRAEVTSDLPGSLTVSGQATMLDHKHRAQRASFPKQPTTHC